MYFKTMSLSHSKTRQDRPNKWCALGGDGASGECEGKWLEGWGGLLLDGAAGPMLVLKKQPAWLKGEKGEAARLKQEVYIVSSLYRPAASAGDTRLVQAQS